ncbi:MAG: DNA polymerase domain-containing protein [Candidatus Freyarchaeota archaeon]
MEGWVTQSYVDGNRAVNWLRTLQGSIEKVEETYYPDFYVLPRRDLNPDGFSWLLREEPRIFDAQVEWKYADLRMRKKIRVVHIQTVSPKAFREVINILKRRNAVAKFYGTDITHIQRYLCVRGFAPTMLVEYRNHQFTKIEDLDELAPPPLTKIFLRAQTDKKGVLANPKRDSIKRVTLYDSNGEEEELSGNEYYILESLQRIIQSQDPDILVAPGGHPFGDLHYIVQRAKILGLNINLSREDGDSIQPDSTLWSSWRGRAYVSLESFERFGLAGLSELCRFGMIPLGLAAKWAVGRIVDCRQVYEAMKMGILIPEAKSYSSSFRTVEELYLRDRGGLIISPRVGVHENVCALDFESMYPNLILRRNISYETCTFEGIDCSWKGLLPRVAEVALERRLHFKHLRRSFPEGSPEYVYADQRQEALKMMLVVIYGYSGCTWNRFQNVPTFESINLHGREILIRAINISMREGFQVVYADTDCLFVKNQEASKEDFERLAEQISEEVNFRIAIDNLYRFLVLLPSKLDPMVDVVKRYYGKLYDGRLHQRGIEVRRHDTPKIIKKFQEELMETLLNAQNIEEVKKNYHKAVEFTLKTCNRILSGEVDVSELVVEKDLHKSPDEYSRIYPHVAAGKQLENYGTVLKEGQLVRYIYVNHRSSNPLTRVQALPLYDGRSYDREKYCELILEAAETLLKVFGFNKKDLHPPLKIVSLKNTV